MRPSEDASGVRTLGTIVERDIAQRAWRKRSSPASARPVGVDVWVALRALYVKNAVALRFADATWRDTVLSRLYYWLRLLSVYSVTIVLKD